MDKPTPTTKSAIDWHQAADWISELLGYDMRDTLGKFTGDKVRPVELRDYWNFLSNRTSVRDGGRIMIWDELTEGCEPWQAEITQAFIDHFGDGCKYFVEQNRRLRSCDALDPHRSTS